VLPSANQHKWRASCAHEGAPPPRARWTVAPRGWPANMAAGLRCDGRSVLTNAGQWGCRPHDVPTVRYIPPCALLDVRSAGHPCTCQCWDVARRGTRRILAGATAACQPHWPEDTSNNPTCIWAHNWGGAAQRPLWEVAVSLAPPLGVLRMSMNVMCAGLWRGRSVVGRFDGTGPPLWAYWLVCSCSAAAAAAQRGGPKLHPAAPALAGASHHLDGQCQ
jgi:hypothetical protein